MGVGVTRPFLSLPVTAHLEQKRLRVRGLFKRRICFAIIKGDKDPSPCSVGPNWLYCHQLLCNTLQPERRRPGTSHTMAWPLFSQPLLE